MPTIVKDVPAAIPCNGILIPNEMAILPPGGLRGTAAPAISGTKALTIGRQIVNAHPYPATALLGSVTDPTSIPLPGAGNVPFRTIRDRLAWVVTFTAPAPMDVTVRGPFPKGAKPANPVLVSRMNVVIDAQTGAVLFAFFTV